MGDILPRILDRLMNRKQEVFPWTDGTQYIHDEKFGQVLSELRHIVINMPVVENSVNYHNIVREWPPVGSDFSPRGGYTTPEGVTITKTMRDKVKALKLEYGSRGEQDLHRLRITPLSPRSLRQENTAPRRTARFAEPRTVQPCSLIGIGSDGHGASGGADRATYDRGNRFGTDQQLGQSGNAVVGRSAERLPRPSSNDNGANQQRDGPRSASSAVASGRAAQTNQPPSDRGAIQGTPACQEISQIGLETGARIATSSGGKRTNQRSGN